MPLGSFDERERRWLFTEVPPPLIASQVRHLQQMTLDYTEQGRTIRRLRADLSDPTAPVYELTAKQGQGTNRYETTIEVSAEKFKALTASALGRPYHKQRHCYPFGDLTLEADLFADDLDGLRIVEIEFESDETMHSFQPLDWFGPEVSSDDRFSNARLGLDGLPMPFELWRRFGRPRRWPEVGLDDGLTTVIDLLERRLSTATRPLIVGTAGGSASGKTSRVASELARRFGERAVVLSMDDYYRGRKVMAELAAAGRPLTWDEPEAVDLELVAAHLERLRSGIPVAKPRYDFASGERVGDEPIQPRPLIIVEGLFALHQPVLSWLDLRLFVAVGAHSQFIRRMFRDPERTGQEPGEISRYLTEVVMPMHDRYVETTRPLADIVFTNDFQPEVEAYRAGPGIVQLKFRGWVDRRVLRQAGASLVTAVTQVDDYLEPDRPLGQEIFRLRREGPHLTLAYKGPPTDGWRQRPTLHFAIDEETAAALQLVYRHQLRRVSKQRTLYGLPGALVALDDVTVESSGQSRQLGRMTEVRFLDPQVTNDQVVATIDRLRLSMADHLSASYAVL